MVLFFKSAFHSFLLETKDMECKNVQTKKRGYTNENEHLYSLFLKELLQYYLEPASFAASAFILSFADITNLTLRF